MFVGLWWLLFAGLCLVFAGFGPVPVRSLLHIGGNIRNGHSRASPKCDVHRYQSPAG